MRGTVCGMSFWSGVPHPWRMMKIVTANAKSSSPHVRLYRVVERLDTAMTFRLALTSPRGSLTVVEQQHTQLYEYHGIRPAPQFLRHARPEGAQASILQPRPATRAVEALRPELEPPQVTTSQGRVKHHRCSRDGGTEIVLYEQGTNYFTVF